MALVAVAGPGDELLPGLGGRAAAARPDAHRRQRTRLPGRRDRGSIPIVGLFLFYFILTNLVLGLFNLLPIPPLDGGRIAVGLLPLELARAWARLERFGIVLVILVVFLLPHLIPGFDPFGEALETVVPWAIDLLLRLSGHDIGAGDVHI